MPSFGDSPNYGGMLSGSRLYCVGEVPEVVVPVSVSELVAVLGTGPKTADEMAEALGISRNAVIKRIFYARKCGFHIILSSHLYRLAHGEKRTCAKCGKELSAYNKSDVCFACHG